MRGRVIREHLRGEGGVAAVEFGLVLPVLILLVFGIIEFSLLFYDKAVITNASREAARSGIVYRVPPVTDEEIQAVATNYCQNRLITFGAPNQVTTEIERGGTGTTGDSLTVRVGYQYTFLALPNFVADLTGGIQLLAQTVMRME